LNFKNWIRKLESWNQKGGIRLEINNKGIDTAGIKKDNMAGTFKK